MEYCEECCEECCGNVVRNAVRLVVRNVLGNVARDVAVNDIIILLQMAPLFLSQLVFLTYGLS